VSFAASSVSSPPPLAGMSPRSMVVVTGFVYSPVGSVLLLVGFAVVSR
jgi:hypothetical protein